MRLQIKNEEIMHMPLKNDVSELNDGKAPQNIKLEWWLASASKMWTFKQESASKFNKDKSSASKIKFINA